MRKNFGAKAILYPMPVLIIGTYDENGKPNAMNAAWGGISEENEISVCLSEEHKTTENIIYSGAFTVSIADAKHVTECDYLGVVSGNKVENKLEKCGFSTTRSELVNAPIINELPMALECKMKSYDPETCRLVGEIVNLSIDDSALDKNGNVDLSLLAPITYDPMNHNYVALGAIVGQAFSDGLKLK